MEVAMSRFALLLSLCLAAVGHDALADTVVTRTGGTLHDPDYLLGGAAATGPYVLEIRSEFDPASVHSYNNGASVSTSDSDITITLTIDGHTSEYSAHGTTSLSVGNSGGPDPTRQFMHSIMFYDGYRIKSYTDVWQVLYLPADSFADMRVLQPASLDFDGHGASAGYLSGGRYEDWGDVFIHWSAVSASDNWYSLQILTEVPEPRNAGMLLAGLILLVPVLHRRVSRQR
jgi:hypothetical protein